jgi:glycosyltransferase involved in cell wall biosynthesis
LIDTDARKTAQPYSSRTTPAATFSIVIPTYNEEGDIGDTLRCALAQQLPVHEIIVVDGGSTDATVARVRRSVVPGARIEIVEEGRRRGVSAARNEGIRRATGDIVVILNADVLLPPDFLERLTPLYAAGADVVSVDSRVANTDCIPGRYIDAVHRANYGAANVGWSEGFSCRREAALAAAFPEEIPGAGGEDVEFLDRLRRLGYRWQVDYSICVEHRVPSTMAGFWEQCRGRGRSIPYCENALRRWPLPFVTARRAAAWLKTLALAGLLIPNVMTAARLASKSSRGMRDLPAMWFAHHMLFAAHRSGELQGLRELWRARKAAP